MHSLLYLLLELQQLQALLAKVQAAHNTHIVANHPSFTAVRTVTTVASPSPVVSTPLSQNAPVTQSAPVMQNTATVNTQTLTPTPVVSQPVSNQPVVSQQVAQIPAAQTTAGDFRSQVEADVLADTNVQRAQNGLPALTADSQVAAVARAHSDDMLANNYFAHNALNGCDPGCRLSNTGYRWMSYGENIHWMSGYNLSAADTAQKIVTDWMNSPPHRENILGNFTYAGIGISVSGDKVYSTADYTTK